MLSSRKRGRGTQYLVKWRGYDDEDDNTWEPSRNLHPDLIRDFENGVAGGDGAPAAPKAEASKAAPPAASKGKAPLASVGKRAAGAAAAEAAAKAALDDSDDDDDDDDDDEYDDDDDCLLYTSPSPRDGLLSRMPSSA